MKEDKWKDPYAFVQKGSDLLCTVYERRELAQTESDLCSIVSANSVRS